MVHIFGPISSLRLMIVERKRKKKKNPFLLPIYQALHLEEHLRVRAFCHGRKIRSQLGFPIHRVFVSPFLRCVETTSQVVSAHCVLHDDPNNLTGGDVTIDPSRLKVFSVFSHSAYIYIYIFACTYIYIYIYRTR